jgi:hypothetical protein
MLADRNQDNLILNVRMFDDQTPPAPIPGIAWNDGTLILGYKRQGDTGWTDLVGGVDTVAGTLGTYIEGGWVSDSGGNGLYEFGLPNAARIAGHRTLLRFKHGPGQYRYDAIDYVAIPSEKTDALEFSFAVPGATIDFSSTTSIYIKETGVIAEFTANQDISAIPLVLIFEDSNGVDQFVFSDEQLTKVGDKVSITLPNEFTDTEVTLNWGIRNQLSNRFYGSGSISVTYAPYLDEAT